MSLRWVDKRAVVLLHRESLAEHGGAEGMRDEGALDSALARPQFLEYYESVTDVPRLAACYGWGLAQNHPFVDGNKRMAFLAVGLFLGLNGFDLVADERDSIETILGVAGGAISEEQFADWIARNIERI